MTVSLVTTFLWISSSKMSILFSRRVKLYSKTGMISFKLSAHEKVYFFFFELLLLALMDCVIYSNNSSLYNCTIEYLMFCLNSSILPWLAWFWKAVSTFFSRVEKLYSRTPMSTFMSNETVFLVSLFFDFFSYLDRSETFYRNSSSYNFVIWVLMTSL